MNKTIARIFLGLPGLFILSAGLVFLSNPAGVDAGPRSSHARRVPRGLDLR